MPEENVQLIHEAFARFQAGDERWTNFVHPEIEWDFTAFPLVDVPSTGRGKHAVVGNIIPTYYSGWLDYQAEITETLEAGDDVLVVQHEIVRIGDSDTVLERDVFHVWTIRDRMWVGWRIYPDRESAVEALGP